MKKVIASNQNRLDLIANNIGIRKKGISAPLFLIFFYSLLTQSAARAQTGEITGRVIADDGAGLPYMIVFLNSGAGDQRNISGDSESRTFTDSDGRFKFTGLGPGPYAINVSNAKGYVRKPAAIGDMQSPVYYRPGDRVTISMIKGGAISGRVTNIAGEALIGVQVNAVMARDAEGKPVRTEAGARWRFTNDRGLYRIYGLQPGTYLVFARNNAAELYPTPYDEQIPTYHPSSNKGAAREVSVTSGDETGGVDIRYREERGHTLSGTVIGGKYAGDSPAVSIFLFDLTSGTTESTYLAPGSGRGYAFSSLPDGEYAVIARTTGDDIGMASAPRNVSLKGSDISATELRLLPLASISGRVVVDSSELCDSKHNFMPEEFTLNPIRDDQSDPDLLQRRNFSVNKTNEKGEFVINDLDPGHYRIGTRLAHEHFYVKTISMPMNSPLRRGGIKPLADSSISLNGVRLKQGEKLTGVTVTIAEGAAGLSGKVVSAKGDALSTLRVHLIPAEPNSNNLLRYAEAPVRADGAFVFGNLAPGRFRLLVREAIGDEISGKPQEPIAWDSKERAKLREESDVLKFEIELKPCQRVRDLTINYRK